MHQGAGRDWNEGHPDHEGEMAVTQLHRLSEMSSMLLEIIGEDDDLPGWIQYKIARAYSDINDAFGYLEAKNHMSPGVFQEEMMSLMPEADLRKKLRKIIRESLK